MSGHTDWLLTVAWSPKAERIATAGWDKTAREWDAHTSKELLTLSHNGIVPSVAWNPDGKRLATGSEDRTAKVWSIGSETIKATEELFDELIAFRSSKSRTLAGMATWYI